MQNVGGGKKKSKQMFPNCLKALQYRFPMMIITIVEFIQSMFPFDTEDRKFYPRITL